MTEQIIGKYNVIQNKTLKNNEDIDIITLRTDNCREAVWTANKDPDILTPVHICGERDFYKGDDGMWHSFEL